MPAPAFDVNLPPPGPSVPYNPTGDPGAGDPEKAPEEPRAFSIREEGKYEGARGANGARDGRGMCTWPDGSVYAGDWKDGLRDGNGKFVSVEGYVYTGEWVKDLKHGKGIHLTADGTRIVGFWQSDRLNGMAY